MGALWQDFQYGLRLLRKGPVFTAVALMTLALGIGANSAIFSVVNAVLIKPLPYKDPARLVAVESINLREGGGGFGGVSPADFWDWKEQNQTFEQLAAYVGGVLGLADVEPPEIIPCARVSVNFFQAFGVEPLTGRAFLPEEGWSGGPRAIVTARTIEEMREDRRIMHFRVASFAWALILMGCSNGQLLPNASKHSVSEAQVEQPGAAARNRNQIVPLVAAHQHLLGPGSVPEPEPSLPEIKLPPDLQSLLQERGRVSGSTEPSDLFTENAMVLKLGEATWARGRSAIQTYMGFVSKGVVYVPNAYGVSGSVGYIAGGVRKVGSTHDELNFLLALQRDSSNKWHIAAETDTIIPPPEFTKSVTADQLVQELDEAGIQKGVVLSIAYWYGSPLHKPVEDEYAKVRAENDWTAQQVARYPQRLVFFCGVNPLKDYAIAELERCAKMPQMKGIKLHFANSGVDVRDAKHLEKVRNFFRAANDHKLAIVAHMRSLRGDYGRRDAEIFIKDVLPVAPDIPIQLAHLAGAGPGYGPDEAMAAYSEAIASGDPRTRNLYFDVTNCVTLKNAQSQERLALIAKRLRQAGLKRIFFGSDMSTDTNAPPGPWWVAFRRKLPLTNDELKVIANNVPPYMQ